MVPELSLPTSMMIAFIYVYLRVFQVHDTRSPGEADRVYMYTADLNSKLLIKRRPAENFITPTPHVRGGGQVSLSMADSDLV